MTAQDIKALYETLDSAAAPWSPLWRELARYIQPRRYHDQSMRGHSPANPDAGIHASLYDSTGVMANQTLAGGMLSWTTPKDNQWFRYAAPEYIEDDDADVYLGKCTERIQRQVNRSNFYKEMHEFHLDRSGFGTACILRSFDQEKRRFKFRTERDFVCSEGPDDTIDTVICRRTYSHRQAAALFGVENLPPEIQKQAADPKTSGQTAQYIHAAIPNPNLVEGSRIIFEMPYISAWLHLDTAHECSRGGAMENPYLVSRFLTWSGSNPNAPYGWSPAWIALPEMRQVGTLEKALDALIDIAVNPRSLVPHNLTGRIDFRPGGVTVLPEDGAKPELWAEAGEARDGFARAEQKRKIINDAFLVPLFQMFATLEDRERTAQEIRARLEEKVDNASPTFDLFGDEVLKPMGQWMFSTGMEEGLFPTDVPSSLIVDGEFMEVPEIEFSSRFALAIRASQDRAALNTVMEVAQLAEADPTVLDEFDLPGIGRDLYRGSGARQTRLRPEAEVRRIRDEREQMQAVMMQQQLAASGAA